MFDFKRVDFAKVLKDATMHRPLIYHMTNVVAMSEQAHLALAIGASPVMSLYPGEAAELVSAADVLLVNIGTPSREGIEAMFVAAREARELGKPAILDPVGYGATKMRVDLVNRLLDTKAFRVIKGNGAEIAWWSRSPGARRRFHGFSSNSPGCQDIGNKA